MRRHRTQHIHNRRDGIAAEGRDSECECGRHQRSPEACIKLCEILAPDVAELQTRLSISCRGMLPKCLGKLQADAQCSTKIATFQKTLIWPVSLDVDLGSSVRESQGRRAIGQISL